MDRKIILSKPTFRVLAIAWSVAVLFATLSPPDIIPMREMPIPHFDKVVHFGLFFVLAFLVSAAVESDHWAIIALASGSILAVLTESLQSFIPGRESGFVDLAADIGGTAIGLFTIYFIKKNE